MSAKKPLGITELVLRDAHQSLLATRMRIEDMLPIADKIDRAGFWSIESWGGATFDACIRYLGEDPWERIRRLKEAMPNTPQQMLFRGQNILGYRHYADDLVHKFVERCAANGVDVFRIFDALNDLRNLETAVKATLATKLGVDVAELDRRVHVGGLARRLGVDPHQAQRVPDRAREVLEPLALRDRQQHALFQRVGLRRITDA